MTRTWIALFAVAGLTASAHAVVDVFTEDFDGAYTPFIDDSGADIDVSEIGETGNLNAYEVGSSSASGFALGLSDDDVVFVETVAEVDLSSYTLANLTLHFAVAADPTDFENDQIDLLAIRLDGLTATAGEFLPAGMDDSNMTNGSITLGFTFQDVSIPLSAFAGLTQADLADLQIQVVMAASSTSEKMGVDSIRISNIPEPASLALLGLGGLCMLGRGRRAA